MTDSYSAKRTREGIWQVLQRGEVLSEHMSKAAARDVIAIYEASDRRRAS